MSEEKKKQHEIKVSAKLITIDLIAFLSLFVLFLNWVVPNFVPSWLVTVSFWFIVFILAILGAILLVGVIAIIIACLIDRW